MDWAVVSLEKWAEQGVLGYNVAPSLGQMVPDGHGTWLDVQACFFMLLVRPACLCCFCNEVTGSECLLACERAIVPAQGSSSEVRSARLGGSSRMEDDAIVYGV